MLPPTFLGFRGRWNITLDSCLRGCMGAGKGDPQRTPRQRLGFGSGPPQPLPCDTQESINALELSLIHI